MKKILKSILAIFGINNNGNSIVKEELSIGLENSINLTFKNFEQNNHTFLIDIAKDNVVVIQLVHGLLIPLSFGKSIHDVDNSEREFNFSMNLTFDNEEKELTKFKNLNCFGKFDFYQLQDGISCYSINFGRDRQQIKEVTLDIIRNVYGYQLNDSFEFQIYDQGRF